MANSKIKKQSKPKIFLFFLFFSTLLWVLTKFSKQYSSNVKVQLEYHNLPENTLLSDAPNSVQVNYSANGFEFLYYRVKPPKMALNLNKYYKEGGKSIVIHREAIEEEVSKELDREAFLSNTSQKSIEVQLDRIENKEVPIIIDAEIQLQKGFRQVDSIQITPSRVMLSAPSQVLDSIKFVYTAKWEAKNVNKDLEKKIKLKVPKFEKTFLDLDEVTASIKVAEYTQKNIQVPITVINKPSNVTLMLIPEVISLMVDVDVDLFNDISEVDFVVECDYNKRNEEDGVLYAKLKSSPAHIYDVKLSEVEIDYLIFK